MQSIEITHNKHNPSFQTFLLQHVIRSKNNTELWRPGYSEWMLAILKGSVSQFSDSQDISFKQKFKKPTWNMTVFKKTLEQIFGPRDLDGI